MSRTSLAVVGSTLMYSGVTFSMAPGRWEGESSDGLPPRSKEGSKYFLGLSPPPFVNFVIAGGFANTFTLLLLLKLFCCCCFCAAAASSVLICLTAVSIIEEILRLQIFLRALQFFKQICQFLPTKCAKKHLRIDLRSKLPDHTDFREHGLPKDFAGTEHGLAWWIGRNNCLKGRHRGELLLIVVVVSETEEVGEFAWRRVKRGGHFEWCVVIEDRGRRYIFFHYYCLSFDGNCCSQP